MQKIQLNKMALTDQRKSVNNFKTELYAFVLIQ